MTERQKRRADLMPSDGRRGERATKEERNNRLGGGGGGNRKHSAVTTRKATKRDEAIDCLECANGAREQMEMLVDLTHTK